MSSPLSDTVSPGVYLAGCWQAGREAGSTSTGTSSHWQQRETRLEVLELPFSRPPFPLFLATLRSLPHFSPSPPHLPPVQRHIAGGGKPWRLCAHQGPPFYPYETTVLTHWPDINIASDHRPSSFSNNSSILRPFFFFFSKQAFHVSRDRYRVGIDSRFRSPSRKWPSVRDNLWHSDCARKWLRAKFVL